MTPTLKKSAERAALGYRLMRASYLAGGVSLIIIGVDSRSIAQFFMFTVLGVLSFLVRDRFPPSPAGALRAALEDIASMPEYDQDDAHRLRNRAREALKP